VFSERLLLSLVDKGIARDTAYRIVQRHALKAGKNGGDLKRELLQDPEMRRLLSPAEIEAAWDLKHHLANVDFVFRRVFNGAR
jgi:adenylosuccinate lyase